MIDLLMRSFPLLLKGLQMTVSVMLLSGCISITLGLFFGIFLSKRLRIPFFSNLIEWITFVYRAVPFYVQLLIVYYVIPELFGLNLEPFAAAVIALGMCSSGYIAQIVRTGINSISGAQWEAAFTLGYNKWQSLQSIILPQMIRNMMGAFINEFDSLIKSTAVVSSIGLLELTRVGMNLVSREMEPVPIYLSIALFYIGLSAFLNIATRILERKMTYVKN